MNTISMILISLLAGFLSTMNVWVYKVDHMRFHMNDIYMVLLMTSWMILLSGIQHYYYTNQIMLIIMSAISIIVIIYLIRTQTFINNTQFMKGMIPHHSMAIQMAEKIKEKSTNQNVIELANNIIYSQNKEIALMKQLGY